MTRILLIDADVFAFRVAAACERATDWGGGYYTWACDFNEVKDGFDKALEKIKEDLNAPEAVLCLTDSDGNFRKGVYPSYKDHRAKTKKPLVLRDFKQFLIDERGAYFKPGLEGDDCMGILATRKNPIGDERIIVSIDKDMKTIPGLYYNDGKPEEGLQTISEDEADYWHIYQTIVGDQTDGYPGCPGVGAKKATAILDASEAGAIDPETSHLEWLWSQTVKTYEKAKLTEDDAIVQARCARILRASDYDFKAREPILWNPPEIR